MHTLMHTLVHTLVHTLMEHCLAYLAQTLGDTVTEQGVGALYSSLCGGRSTVRRRRVGTST